MGDDLVRNIDESNWHKHYMTRSEIDALADWLDHHRLSCKANRDITVAHTHSSGIGQNTVVRCGCGEGKDITDYGSW